MLTLYHYTSKEGGEGIAKSKKIYKSVPSQGPGHATWGPGVYFTDLDWTTYSLETIAKNNWTEWESAIKNQKLTCCIIVEIPENEIELCCVEKRKIFKYPDRDLDLTLYKYKIEMNFKQVSHPNTCCEK